VSVSVRVCVGWYTELKRLGVSSKVKRADMDGAKGGKATPELCQGRSVGRPGVQSASAVYLASLDTLPK
jgi:hypothetical protein